MTSRREAPRVVLVPRWAGSASHDFVPWLRGALGVALVVAPLLPLSQRPEVEPTVAALLEVLRAGPLRRAVLVGHSVGCQAVFRALAQLTDAELEAGVAGVVAVAGWWTVDAPWDALQPWLTPFDVARARRAARRVKAFLSTDDPYTADWRETGRRFERELGAEVRVLDGRRHFTGPEQPEVLAAVQALLDEGEA